MRRRVPGATLALSAVASLAWQALPAGAPVTLRASVDASGSDSNGSSYSSSLSADGRFVAFASSASDLVPGDASDLVVGDGNGEQDVFVRSRGQGCG